MKTTGSYIEVRNPRTGMLDYTITPPSTQEIKKTCEKLRKSQSDWQAKGVAGRIEVLQQWKSVLLENKHSILDALVADTGRLRESIREFDNIIKWIDRYARLAPGIMEMKHGQATSIPFVELSSDYAPYQLVGVISPWNFPLSLSMMDMLPALVAGCTAIVKPSEVTPRFIEPIMKTIEKVPPLAEVLTFIVGAGDTGAELIEHVDLVCFTGSVATGRKVAQTAAQRFIPAYLELGGKDPAVVLKTADLERATSAILFGSVYGAGHMCLSIERVYVDHSIYEPFIALLVEKAKKLDLVYPEVEKGHIGPIIFQRQADIIADHLQDAVEKGAHVHCGGTIEELGGGLWCRPTVLSKVNHSMKVMMDETFGPLIPVMPFTDEQEAIRLANDTEYGLNAAVFAGTAEEALSVARQIDAGGISINDAGLTPFFIGEGEEKSAFKCSGMGASRSGASVITRFLRKKVYLNNTSCEASPWWYE